MLKFLKGQLKNLREGYTFLRSYPSFAGKIRVVDPLETHQDAIRLATLNALTAARACLEEGEKISLILQLNVFLNAEEEFTTHAKIANYASDALMENLVASC
jgi:hypothetical protein